MNTKDMVASLIIQHFYYKELYENKESEIEKIRYQMAGVHGISFDKISGAAEPRDNKLVRLSEKLEPLEKEKEDNQLRCKDLYMKLKLYLLKPEEYRLLELIYRYHKKLENVALIIGYSDKTVVSRKRGNIIELLATEYEK